MSGQIWDTDEMGPMPALCGDCAPGVCPHESEFFYRVVDGVLYGPFACICPTCTPGGGGA